MDEVACDSENKHFGTFGRSQEFFDALSQFLLVDLHAEPTPTEAHQEEALLRKLTSILNEIQELSYLLDPFLERMITPTVNAFKTHAAEVVEKPDVSVSTSRVGRLAELIYWYTRTRGYKTCIRFFPHQVSDLPIALGYLLLPNSLAQQSSQWPLRYITLLWLSLICMTPFDLALFDENTSQESTANKLQSIGTMYLDKAGLEREAAALLLSRLYARKDMATSLQSFLESALSSLQNTQNGFITLGILQLLCDMTKSGGGSHLLPCLPAIKEIVRLVNHNLSLFGNTLVRKFNTKLLCRVTLIELPTRRQVAPRRGRVLGNFEVKNEGFGAEEDEDIDVPEDIESAIEDIFQSLRDKDTVVRWSAAKSLARISERLPKEFADQILETILGLFSIHSADGGSELPATAEATWHGACLACAELARRGMVSDDHLPDVFKWLLKALYFDIRKGAHSIGSSVRDAAAYVVWSLARTQDVNAIKPFAMELARHLVVVSLYDREIQIRRAASAAFQENVGRMNLFPHGIDILRKTDFYAVSIRRNAFITAAPQVAEHDEYRQFLIDHLLITTLRHWDPAMRQLGASSLRLVCAVDLVTLGPAVASRIKPMLRSVDLNDIHGALTALSELAIEYQECKKHPQFEAERLQIYRDFITMPLSTFQKYRSELVLEAACNLIANCVSLEALQLDSPTPRWKAIFELGLKHQSESVQEAAAAAMASISRLVDYSTDVKRFVKDFNTGSPLLKQSIARTLGVISYQHFSHGIGDAIACLLGGVGQTSSTFSSNVEARRNCFSALRQLVLNLPGGRIHELLNPAHTSKIFEAFISGLDDYTTDERGDVGSWIRLACIEGVGSVSQCFLENSGTLQPFEDWLPLNSYHEAIGRILKQGVERLDNVRQKAGEQIMTIVQQSLPDIPGIQAWRMDGQELVSELLSSNDDIAWTEGKWLFPRAVQLLSIPRYRKQVLIGLILSIGSKNEGTQTPASESLAQYATSLPVKGSKPGDFDLMRLISGIVALAQQHVKDNSMMVPILHTLGVLLDDGDVGRLAASPEGLNTLHAVVNLAGRNADRIKSVQRILASMKIAVSMLGIPEVSRLAASFIQLFLGHRFPKVRAATAETLYVLLQTHDIVSDSEELEELLLETEWPSGDPEDHKDTVQKVVVLLGP
ncbi:hypothetical protein BOTBODRAFT_457108 [Botryobasidium botryosum FD-172 SS1]|uniref:Uncharacterized protein n=1 Tax=Botryobasidium botryosum (strain FD-172 SS1) TaxID=930990 RepID=A0A067M6V6_BOTB1|nr:hypothetical protein BOTBODRAFT_457108 [Botryobasidium botryosum FD-172 SS1]